MASFMYFISSNIIRQNAQKVNRNLKDFLFSAKGASLKTLQKPHSAKLSFLR